jgi:glycosyltransferase involved in cell wall biosynthesis
VRILQVVHQYAPHHVGGTEIYTRSLARELARLGHEISVFTRVNRPPQGAALTVDCESSGETVYRWWCPEPNGVYNLFKDSYANAGILEAFKTVSRAVKPDVVHLQHLKGMHYRLPACARDDGARLVLTLHDYWYFCANAQLLRPGGYVCGGPRLWLNCADCAAHRVQLPLLLAGAPFIAGLMAQRSRRLANVLHEAQVIIAPSQSVADLYAKHADTQGKLRVVEHGIESMFSSSAVRNRVGPLHILFAGGLSRQKGAHVLIEAFRALPEGAAVLNICGDETAFPEYVHQLKQCALGYAVNFHGALPREQLANQMLDADVLAIPSLWPETASLVALEAQSIGLPIIASDLGALRERVARDADGWLVPPGDVLAWQRVISERASFPEHVRAMRATKPVRQISQHVAELAQIYGETFPTTRKT